MRVDDKAALITIAEPTDQAKVIGFWRRPTPTLSPA